MHCITTNSRERVFTDAVPERIVTNCNKREKERDKERMRERETEKDREEG
jgi:hypothetical protein